MILGREACLKVFKKVKFIREEYKLYILGANINVLSIQDLETVISQMYGVKFVKTQVAFDGEYLRGMMERWPDHVKIRVRQDQSEDQKRFTAVKEMCHVVVDEKEDWSVDGVSTITSLLYDWALETDEEAQRATHSEMLAEVAALELLYPFECRAGDLKLLAEDATTPTKIATYHKMPIRMVSRALTLDYHTDFAGSIWAEIESENQDKVA